MKIMVVTGMLLLSSAAFAKGSIECKNGGLGVRLTSQGSDTLLEVISSGPEGNSMPRVGEKAVLFTNYETSQEDYLNLSSQTGSEARIFEVSIPKAGLEKGNRSGKFNASLRVGSVNYHYVLSNYGMSCELK